MSTHIKRLFYDSPGGSPFSIGDRDLDPLGPLRPPQ